MYKNESIKTRDTNKAWVSGLHTTSESERKLYLVLAKRKFVHVFLKEMNLHFLHL